MASCDMCGSTNFKLLGMRLSRSQGLDPRSAEGIAVPVKQCECGLIFSDPLPIPRDIADHYGVAPDQYWQAQDFDTPADYFADEIATAKRLLDFKPGMTALDIGVGYGRISTALTRAGFDTWGIEPSAPFRDKAIEVLGIAPERIQLAAMEEADFPSSSFDFITFGAVLEHLYSPSFALERALRWLKPNGIIQAEVPSSRWLLPKLINLYFRLRGTNYVTHLSPMHVPFHLYEFTLDAFRRNGARVGYQIADHKFMVCAIYHVPSFLHPVLRWWMERTNSGMQLTVYLRA
ncbi:MAG TPA: class I SAM-dependent methyltransferase [Sphingomicrobium sp.]|nr:class I SAM-dependent methyltransferase [Sphingomicrobium sp.]